MSELDPDSDRIDVTRATYAPGGATEVRRISRTPNNTLLWAVAIIGAVTIGAAAFIIVKQNNGSVGQQMSTVAATQAVSDGAVVAQQSALAAQQSADQSIARSQQVGADQAAHDRAAAEAAAARAAASADQASRDASTVRQAPAGGDAAPQ